MNLTRYKPQALVTFFTEVGDLVARATNDPKSKFDDDVMSIQTTRDLGADAPTFSINLTRRKDWHKWVGSNDKVVIMMHRPPEAQSTVFVGLVDDVRKRVVVQGDTIERVTTVTGRGVSKAFIQFDIGIVPEAEYFDSSIGWIVSNHGIMLSGSTAKQIQEIVWNNIANKFINYKWDNGQTLFEGIQHDLSDKDGMLMLDDSGIINWQGSLWAFMKEIAEEPFYELYWEINNGKPTLIQRPTPFSEKDWIKLPTVTISDEEVVADEVGKSDLETFSLFSVGAKSMFSPNDVFKTFGILPVWNEKYSDKYGIRRLHTESSYVAVADASDIDDVEVMSQLRIDLFNWNIKNNSMLNGTILVKGSNRFKVGNRLLYVSREDSSTLEYYTKSVTNNFVNFGTWTVELGVTRGIDPSERFTAPYNDYTDYSGSGMAVYDPDGVSKGLGGWGDGSTGGTGGGNVPPINGSYLDKAQGVVALANQILSNGINGVRVRYVFGGNSPSTGALDCSSFTQYVYKNAAGMDIGRVTGQQVVKGSTIPRSQVMPGDLIFFKGTYNSPHIYGVSHVGICIGNNQFIHNSSSRAVTQNSIDDSYWSTKILRFQRVLQVSTTEGSGSGTTFVATAYGANAMNLEGGPGWIPTGLTATGTVPKEGRTIAVDPNVIPRHSRVRIESDYPGITGEYIAEDVGGAIKGNRIDIYFNDLPPYDPREARRRMLAFGKRNVKVTILRRGK